jgi:hypothetical protein
MTGRRVALTSARGALVLALAVVLTACSGGGEADPSPTASGPEVGEVVPLAESDLGGGATIEVAMPDGDYVLTTVDVVTAVGEDDDEVTAAEGTAIVTVQVENLGNGYPFGNDAPETAFHVEAGGEMHPFDRVTAWAGSGIVVPGDGSDAVIALTSAGHRLTFDVATGDQIDEAAQLEVSDWVGPVTDVDDPELPEELSDAPSIFGGVRSSTFFPEVGWAEEGMTWLELNEVHVTDGGWIDGEHEGEATVTAIRVTTDTGEAELDLASAETTEGLRTGTTAYTGIVAVPTGATLVALAIDLDSVITDDDGAVLFEESFTVATETTELPEWQ